MSALKDRLDDEEKRAEGLASDANTMVDHTDVDGEKTDVEFEKADTDIEKANAGAEKTDVEDDSGSRNPAAALPEDALTADDYPKGLQFVFILLALIFSIFMVALDLVRYNLSFLFA